MLLLSLGLVEAVSTADTVVTLWRNMSNACDVQGLKMKLKCTLAAGAIPILLKIAEVMQIAGVSRERVDDRSSRSVNASPLAHGVHVHVFGHDNMKAPLSSVSTSNNTMLYVSIW